MKIHVIKSITTDNSFFACQACEFQTNSLSDVARHVVENQYEVKYPKQKINKVNIGNK